MLLLSKLNVENIWNWDSTIKTMGLNTKHFTRHNSEHKHCVESNKSDVSKKEL